MGTLRRTRDDCDTVSDISSIVSVISETDMSDTSIGDVNVGVDTSDEKTEDVSQHTLPFKVMGVVHTNQNQTHLMRAEHKMYSENDCVCLLGTGARE